MRPVCFCQYLAQGWACVLWEECGPTVDEVAASQTWVPEVACALARISRCKVLVICPRLFYLLGLLYVLKGSGWPDGVYISETKLTKIDIQKKHKGIWAVSDPTKKADIIIYYAHGE